MRKNKKTDEKKTEDENEKEKERIYYEWRDYYVKRHTDCMVSE